MSGIFSYFLISYAQMYSLLSSYIECLFPIPNHGKHVKNLKLEIPVLTVFNKSKKTVREW